MKITTQRKIRRKRRVSSNIRGSKNIPRISVFCSNRYTYAQAIDDKLRKTHASFSSMNIAKGENNKRMKKVEEARLAGEELGKRLIKNGIKKAVFDRSIYSYKGRVKALAEGLRKAGVVI